MQIASMLTPPASGCDPTVQCFNVLSSTWLEWQLLNRIALPASQAMEGLTLPMPADAAELWRVVAAACWDRNAKRRPTFRQVRGKPVTALNTIEHPAWLPPAAACTCPADC